MENLEEGEAVMNEEQQRKAILEALRKNSPDFCRWIYGGHGVCAAIADNPCPKCGGQVACAYADMGAVDFYDTFAHVCINPNCDYGKTETFHFSTSLGPDGPKPDCPFCPAKAGL